MHDWPWTAGAQGSTKFKLQGNEYSQWKQWALSSYFKLVWIINWHVLFSTYSLMFNCLRCILQIESFVMTIIALLFSKYQSNVSGRYYRSKCLCVDRIYKLVSNHCRSNQHVGVNRMAFNSKNHLHVLERCLRREQKIIGDCVNLPLQNTFHAQIHCILILNFTTYICIVNTFFVLYQQHSFVLSNCHDLWPIMQAVLLTLKYF